jgi:hypothetical protein
MTNVTESQGAAARIIRNLLQPPDHLYHGRPGMVSADPRSTIGVRWQAVKTRDEAGAVNIYAADGKTLLGQRDGSGAVVSPVQSTRGGRVGEYREAGIFPEVAVWLYEQIAEVWKLDAELAARWASYAFEQDSRDLKVVLAAFMLVQSYKGEPLHTKGEEPFFDDNYREVGTAMILTQKRGVDFNVKMLLRIHEVLTLPQIAQINRDIGFGRSQRNAFLGGWSSAVKRWLRYREANPQMLEGLVKAGFRRSVCLLARLTGYKPQSEAFFTILRWNQKQSSEGHRTLALNVRHDASSWADMSEVDVCEAIVSEKPSWKVIVGRLREAPTRAMVAAAVEAGSFSDRDLVIAAPMLEEMGLLRDSAVRRKFDTALAAATDQRAANIARRVRNADTKAALEDAADGAAQRAVEKVLDNQRVYLIVDTSSSMSQAIELAKQYATKLIVPFPLDRLHVATFTTEGREVTFRERSKRAVEHELGKIRAGGGTRHGQGVRVLSKHKPAPGEDAIMLFIGDEQESGTFAHQVRLSGINPAAFGLVRVYQGPEWHRMADEQRFNCVRATAAELGIPCFQLSLDMFEDAYAIPQVLANLIQATPVGLSSQAAGSSRKTLIEEILETELLPLPVWAA